MSTFSEIDYKCAVCGCTTKINTIMSTNVFGSMDLDTRPPQMRRSTMPMWVQECPKCGYVAGSIENETSVTKDYLASEEYLNCNGIHFASSLAQRFYKQYTIALLNEDFSEAFYASLHAAWACDDAKDTLVAKTCRNNCIDLIPKMNLDDNKDTFTVMKADLLRRAERFDEVVAEFSKIKIKEELLQNIIDFEVARAKDHDSKVYTVQDTQLP